MAEMLQHGLPADQVRTLLGRTIELLECEAVCPPAILGERLGSSASFIHQIL